MSPDRDDPRASTRPPAECGVVTLAGLSRVEEVLDEMEARGVGDRAVVVLAPDRFAVWWRVGGPDEDARR